VNNTSEEHSKNNNHLILSISYRHGSDSMNPTLKLSRLSTKDHT